MPKKNQKQSEESQLQEKLVEAEAKYQRALADYQNLVRRTQADSLKRVKLATKDFASELIEPLNHLGLAAEQLSDPGLNMVVVQLWEALGRQGLEKIECIGKPFDAETMEAVERTKHGEVVVKVLSPGYRLNGEIIQFAKVVLD